MTIQEAVKEIISQRGLKVFKNSKIFLALIDDLAPKYQVERKILRRNIDDSILNLFIDDTLTINNRIVRIKSKCFISNLNYKFSISISSSKTCNLISLIIMNLYQERYIQLNICLIIKYQKQIICLLIAVQYLV